MDVSTSVMDKITGELPSIPVHREEWPHLTGVKLADPHFDHPSHIEVLLGAEIYERILLDGIIGKVGSSPTAQNSRLGWLLFGAVKNSTRSSLMCQPKVTLLPVLSSDCQLSQALQAFWEVEEISEVRKLTVKEQEAEDIFVESVHQNDDGRYVVALPFDPDLATRQIGESRKAALNGLFRLEARFKSNDQLKVRYKDYIEALIGANQ